MRHWVFTLPNYTEEHRRVIVNFVSASPGCYCVYQPEISPTTGTPHLQGFVSFKNPRVLAGVSQLFSPARPHLEPMRGTLDQAIAYCQKEETRDPNAGFAVVELGERPTGPGQGSRTDLDAIGKRLREGESLKAVAADYPGDFIRYGRGFAAYKALFSEPRTRKTQVCWLYGATGGGKSHAARLEAGPEAYWKNMDSSKWWCNYDGVSNVVLDDYRCNFSTFTFLLRLFDEYPLQLESKNGSLQFNAPKIWVTAPKRPEQMWSTREDIQQLLRRIEEIRLVGEEVVEDAMVANFEPGN